MQNYIISVNMDNVMDKSMRSVFVGNIPYEVTDDKLKDIFSEVSWIYSLMIIYRKFFTLKIVLANAMYINVV